MKIETNPIIEEIEREIEYAEHYFKKDVREFRNYITAKMNNWEEMKMMDSDAMFLQKDLYRLEQSRAKLEALYHKRALIEGWENAQKGDD
jgi:hypothetical protein